MTVADIIDFSTATVGDIDQDTRDFAKKAIQLRYQILFASHNWQESIRAFDLVLADTDTFFLPVDCELIIFVVPVVNGVKYGRLAYRERDWIEQNASIGPYLTNFGPRPWYFYRSTNVGFPSASPGVLTFSVLETSSINIYVAGKDANGNPLSEKMSVATARPGTPSTPSTANNYSVVTTISKDVSTYPVTVTGTDGTTAQISPGTTELVYTKGMLWPPLQGSADFTIGAKLKADTLDDDMSVPRISRLWNALIGFTNAALYKRQRQLGKAQAETQDAQAIVEAAVQEEKNQAAFRQQVVPQVYDGNYFPWGAAQFPTTSWPWGYGEY